LADFEVEDVCEDKPALFINRTKITSDKANCLWYFGDGRTSMADSPLHSYQINGITKTFNATMVARVPNGCSYSLSKAITINAFPKQGFTYITSGQTVNFTATETNGQNYQWIFGDGGTANNIQAKQEYTYSKFQSRNYIACLKVINLAGYTSDSCMEIQITGSLQPFIKKSGIRVFPNPNDGKFNVEISKSNGTITVEVYNQIIFTSNLYQFSNSLDLNQAKGIYLVKVINGTDIYKQRIIVRK